jgi:hypothetical protein
MPPVRPMPKLDWADTIDTVHMWTQIVGKIKLAQMPWQNHWWHSTLYVSARGLTTNAMPYGDRFFDIELDFVDHRLLVRESAGKTFEMALAPMSVATFYGSLMAGLAALGVNVHIYPRPVEVDIAIPFDEDEIHATYVRDHVDALWSGLKDAERVLAGFRSGFVGKCSPVHFFWGGFDLAVTRFSGRTAPRHRGGIVNCPNWVMEEAYSREVSSAGWWPGTDTSGPSFYSYMYPEPAGFAASALAAPGGYDADLGEFILTERAANATSDSQSAVREFLEATYSLGANLAGWDRSRLERQT